MTAEELLKSAGVCCHMPVCHTPCQIKPAACRAGTATVCCILSLAGSYSPGLGGRKVTVCFAGRNALFSCCFPCETLLAHATLSQRQVSNHHSDFSKARF